MEITDSYELAKRLIVRYQIRYQNVHNRSYEPSVLEIEGLIAAFVREKTIERSDKKENENTTPQ